MVVGFSDCLCQKSSANYLGIEKLCCLASLSEFELKALSSCEDLFQLEI